MSLHEKVDSEKGSPEPGDPEEQPPHNDINYLVQWDDGEPQNPRNFSLLMKWWIVIVVSTGSLLITCASSIYTPTYKQIEKEFYISQEVATIGLSLFVVGLAVGPMFVSPLSESYGRRPIYLVTTFFFVVFNIQCAVAQNAAIMLVGRLLDGLAGSAFLSVAGGSVGDLFIPSELQFPMQVFSVSPFIGPTLGPLVGGFICQFTTWRWCFYVLIIWSSLQLLSVFFVPETYHPVLLARKASALRKSTGNPAYHAQLENIKASRSLLSSLMHSFYRPFQLLLLEPMILCLDLYSAVILGILYLFFSAFPLVFQTNHGFNTWQVGLTFIALMIGNFIGMATHPFWMWNYRRLMAKTMENREKDEDEGNVVTQSKPEPELRLPPAMAGAICVPVGLFWFGWTTYRSVHWIVPIIGSIFFGIGFFLVFSAIFTFLVEAYPVYAASVLASNVFVRCMFAGAFPLFSDQMYKNLGYQWATSLLAFLCVAMMPFPYLFYKYGKTLRGKSRFASGGR